MKIKVELELDTDNVKDQEQIEKITYQLQQVKEILEKLDYNLNKRNTNNKR